MCDHAMKNVKLLYSISHLKLITNFWTSLILDITLIEFDYNKPAKTKSIIEIR